jgi:hypothetical protein
MRNFVFITGILICLMSCRPQRQLIQSQQRDSVVISDRVTEKVVHIAADSVTATLPLLITNNRAQPAKVTVNGKRAKVDLEISSQGEVKATAICKELEEKVNVMERTISYYKHQIEVYKENEPKFKQTLNSFESIVNTMVLIVVILGFLFVMSQSGILALIKKIIIKKQ